MKVHGMVYRLLAFCLLLSLALSPWSLPAQAAPDAPQTPEEAEATAALGEPIVVFEGISRAFGPNAGDPDVNPAVAPPAHLNDANIIGKVPDVAGAAGRIFYLQAANKMLALFQKGTVDINLFPGIPYYLPNPVEAVSFDQLWANVAGNPAYATGTDCDGTNHHGQPNVVYDQKAGVWVALDVAYQQANINTGPYYICVAISTNRMEVSPPPYFVNVYPGAINWYFYAIPVAMSGISTYPDSVKLGVWSDGYYLAADMIDIENNGIQRYPKGAKVWVMNRSDMLAGVPQVNLKVLSQELTFNLNFDHLVPSNWMGGPDPNIPNYFAAIRPGRFFLWKAVVNWPALSFTLGNALEPSTTLTTDTSTIWAGGSIVPQPGVLEKVDALGGRLTTPLQYRRMGSTGSFWTSHAVVWSNATGVRWYELQGMETNNPFFYQSGTYSTTDGSFRWNSALATDKAGNMAMGYNLSRPAVPAVYPSIFYTGRLVNDPPGAITQGEFLLNLTGMPNPYTASQYDIDTFPDGPWGRQSQMTVDPVDECVFWYTNMYYTYEQYDGFGNPVGDGTTWHTRIGAFTLPECRSGGLKRVSLHTNGTEGTQNSGRDIQMYSTGISASGRFVVFTSLAPNLVDLTTNGYSDTNFKYDVFVRDRDYDNDGIFDEPGAVRTERIPRDVQPDNDANEVSISGDGRYVVFASYATNLVSGDTNSFQDIFLYDRDADNDGIFDEAGATSTRRVNVPSGTLNGNALGGDSRHPFISSNGRYVVFASDATNLVPGAVPNTFTDVFIHDRDSDNDGVFDEAGAITTRLVSVGFPVGVVSSDGHSDQPTISSDGRYVAFRSAASNLQELQGVGLADGNGFTDIYVRDMLYDDMVLVSVQDVTGALVNNHSFTPFISGDGSAIVFASQATNLLDPASLLQDLNVFTDIYRAVNPLIGYVPLVVPPVQPAHRLISVNLLGQIGNEDSFTPSTNEDGSVVVFASKASNLDVFFPDTNGERDIFINNLLVTYSGVSGAGATQRISINNALGEPNDESFAPLIASGNPAQVAFVSDATNLVRNDFNYKYDVFAYDGDAGTPVFLRVIGNTVPVLPGQNVSVQVRFYANGYGIDAITYSIDFDQSCLAYINTSFPSIPGFTFDPPLYDPLDTDGELDYALYSFVHNALPDDSLIATITFQVTGQCTGMSGTPEIGRVGFSRNPEAYFTGYGQDVYGIAVDGFVRIGGGNRGDCNKDGRVTAADLSWLIYEIYDGDGNLPENVVNPPYVSDPVGCNSNLDGVVDAGDLPCTVKVLFNGPLVSCATSLAADNGWGEELQPYAPAAPAQLSLPLKSIVGYGSKVYLPVMLTKQGNAVSSLIFSVNYDQTWLSFNPADGNGDGIPDSIIWYAPSGYARSVMFNPADVNGELDFAVYNTSATAQPLPDGMIVMIILDAGSPPGQYVANVVGSNEPLASFGSVFGSTVIGSLQGGTIWIGDVRQIFMPMIRR